MTARSVEVRLTVDTRKYVKAIRKLLPWHIRLRQRLGVALHPGAVTAAWYAADCPPGPFDASDLPLRTRLRWRLVLWLRGARP